MLIPNLKPKLIVILGPTASGKSELAIKLAKKFGGEIISADSRQVYRGMNIGTGKITKKEMSGIPHYLINIISPRQEFNVSIFKKLAVKIVKDIQKRGKLPFLVGGTGLYVRAVCDNIQFPEVPPQKKLRRKLEKKSAEELFRIYQKLDPQGAKFIEKENKRRLIRAVEVCLITKKPFWQQRKKGANLLFDVLQIGIKLPKEKLQIRIIKRVKKMFKSGLEKEVKSLAKKYGWLPVFQTIGYQEWWDYKFPTLSNKEIREIEEKIKIHTLQFVKRQMTWFTRDKEILWVQNYRMAEKLVKNFLSDWV